MYSPVFTGVPLPLLDPPPELFLLEPSPKISMPNNLAPTAIFLNTGLSWLFITIVFNPLNNAPKNPPPPELPPEDEESPPLEEPPENELSEDTP